MPPGVDEDEADVQPATATDARMAKVPQPATVSRTLGAAPAIVVRTFIEPPHAPGRRRSRFPAWHHKPGIGRETRGNLVPTQAGRRQVFQSADDHKGNAPKRHNHAMACSSSEYYASTVEARRRGRPDGIEGCGMAAYSRVPRGRRVAGDRVRLPAARPPGRPARPHRRGRRRPSHPGRGRRGHRRGRFPGACAAARGGGRGRYSDRAERPKGHLCRPQCRSPSISRPLA